MGVGNDTRGFSSSQIKTKDGSTDVVMAPIWVTSRFGWHEQPT